MELLMHKIILGIYALALTVLFGVSACSKKTEAISAESPLMPVATLQELMLAVIDPNIDPIWNSVTTVITKEGEVDKKPQSDEEWKVLRNHALTLIEVSNLLVIEGRPIAAPGSNTSTHETEFGPKEIKAAIDANRKDFIKRSQALQEGAKLLLAAIDAKNPDDLVQAGGVVEHACEQCHTQFWYPNDRRPTAALDLGLKVGSNLYMKIRKTS